MAYILDDSIFEEQIVCRKKLQKLNFMDRSDFEGLAEAVKDFRYIRPAETLPVNTARK